MLGLDKKKKKSVFYSATKGTYSQISPSASFVPISLKNTPKFADTGKKYARVFVNGG